MTLRTPILFLVALSGCGIDGSIQTVVPPSAPLPLAERPEDTEPPIAICAALPAPAAPGESVDLIGENSYDPDEIPLTQYRWELVSKPFGSRASLPTGQANILGFEPDVIGAYTAALTVTNDRGNRSTPCAAPFEVLPEQRLWVEIDWRYPGDDIDLVVIRDEGAFDSLDSCREGICNGDWGQPGDVIDDPQLVATDREGTGPETVGIIEPRDSVYWIGIYDNPDSVRNGSNETQMRIYGDGQQIWEGSYAVTGEPGGPWEGFDPPDAPVYLAKVRFPSSGPAIVRPCADPAPGEFCN